MNCLLKAVMVETLPRINHLAGRIDKNKKREAVAGKFVVKRGIKVVVGPREFLLRPELRGFLNFIAFIDAHENKPFRVQLLQVRYRVPARRTPRGPKVEKQRLSHERL